MEEEQNNKIEERKKKIKNWFKDYNNLALFSILLISIVIRFYFFFLTKNQPLWWDELAYGSLAKNFVTHFWDGTSMIVHETEIRPLFFPLLWSGLLRLGFSESFNRFLLSLLPSVLSVFLIYKIGYLIFNKKTGLISAAIFSVLWLNLFYSVRFLVHSLELLFLSFSIYLFIKSIKESLNYKLF